MTKLDYLKYILACPRCHKNLIFKKNSANCIQCKLSYKFENNKFYFTKPFRKPSDSLDGLKFFLKNKFGFLYYKIGVEILAPSYPFNFLSEIKNYINLKSNFVVDLGGGALKLSENIISIDIYDYKSVDVICDAQSLPFKNNSLDVVISRSLLEHVIDPLKIISEIDRCLKKNGYTAHLIPFMMPFHASPHDYRRYTHKGVKLLFPGYKIIKQFSPFGPFSLFLQCSIEITSAILSLPCKKAKPYLYIILCAFLFPIKYLDFIFARRNFLIGCAPSIFTIFKK